MKHLPILITLIILVSCSETKRFSKWKDRGERNHWFQKDTILIQGVITKGETLIKLDSAALDSVSDLLAEMYQKLDECDSSKPTPEKKSAIKAKIKEKIQTIPCKANPVNDSTSRYTLKIWLNNGSLMYNLHINDITVSKDCPKQPEPSWWKHFIPHGFIFYGLITMIFWVINLILKGKRL